MTRILIADDLIPERSFLSDQEVRNHYLMKYKDDRNAVELAEWFVFFRKLMLLLRERGYEVDGANTPVTALDFVKRNTYDAIVLDLGWYTLENMSYDDKMLLGFSIADQIRQYSPAQILMFSNRFPERSDLAATAAEKGLLPVYKSHDEACMYHLLVAINWLIHNKTVDDRLREERKLKAFHMYRRLSDILLVSIAFSVLLLGITAVAVVFKYADVQLASALFGFVSTAISGIIYKYVVEYQKSIV